MENLKEISAVRRYAMVREGVGSHMRRSRRGGSGTRGSFEWRERLRGQFHDASLSRKETKEKDRWSK